MFANVCKGQEHSLEDAGLMDFAGALLVGLSTGTATMETL